MQYAQLQNIPEPIESGSVPCGRITFPSYRNKSDTGSTAASQGGQNARVLSAFRVLIQGSRTPCFWGNYSPVCREQGGGCAFTPPQKEKGTQSQQRLRPSSINWTRASRRQILANKQRKFLCRLQIPVDFRVIQTEQMVLVILIAVGIAVFVHCNQLPLD